MTTAPRTTAAPGPITAPTERGRLITRYSLTTSPLYAEVNAYLSQLSLPPASPAEEDEPDRAFGGLLATVRREVDRYPGVGAALRSIAAYVQGGLSEAYVTAFHRVRTSRDELALVYVSTVYARALCHLGYEPDLDTFPQHMRRLLADPGPALAHLRTVLASCPEDFLGHMVAEAAARQGENPFFRQRLARGRELFEQYSGPAAAWLPPGAQTLEVIGPDRLDSPAALPAHMALAMTLHE